MSAADKIGVTSFRRSAPSLGGIRVSFGKGDPSMMSPTAAIEISSDAAGIGVGASAVLDTTGGPGFAPFPI